MRVFLNLVMLSCVFTVFSQEVKVPDFEALDSLYREDQFYVGLTYNILQQRPENLSQNKFSLGLSLGFLRDMPINKERTVAIAVGFGYSLNNFNQNLFITKLNGDTSYSLIDPDLTYDKNKIILHYVDLPIEFRWRTSTPSSHRFWRVYTGLKVSYLFFDNYKFKGNGNEFAIDGNGDLNKFQYGAYMAVGYNTWNFHMYYGLNPLFKNSAQLDGKPLEMHMLNIGLMFYIL